MERRKRLLREREGAMRFWHDFMWSWSGTTARVGVRGMILPVGDCGRFRSTMINHAAD